LLHSELWDYIERLHQLVHSLEAHVQQTQDNIQQIRNIMAVWNKAALFERSDGKKDTLLSIEDRSEHVQRRFVQSEKNFNCYLTQHFVFMFSNILYDILIHQVL
jgi:hypothetical protein